MEIDLDQLVVEVDALKHDNARMLESLTAYANAGWRPINRLEDAPAEDCMVCFSWKQGPCAEDNDQGQLAWSRTTGRFHVWSENQCRHISCEYVLALCPIPERDCELGSGAIGG